MIDPTWQPTSQTSKIYPSKKHRGRLFNNFLMILLFLTIAILSSFLIVNAQAIYKGVQYQVKSNISPHYLDIENQINLTAEANQDIESKNDFLIIPKINLQTPILWSIPENTLLLNLKKGVVQVQSTNLPGDLTGNILLIGYSSLPFWQDQGGGTVFTLLNNLESGDRININYQNNHYVYQVKTKRAITSRNLALDQSSDNKQLLTLMTYWPLGINSQKLLIISELISTSSKTEKSNIDSNNSLDNQLLPGL